MSMKTTNKLNNFQKKSILSELRDFDIIDIIGHVESSAVIKYSFYYKHRGFIFVSEIFWAYERSNSSTPSLEDFVDYLKDKLTKEITKIDIDLFNDSIVNSSSIDLVSNSLFNFITIHFIRSRKPSKFATKRNKVFCDTFSKSI